MTDPKLRKNKSRPYLWIKKRKFERNGSDFIGTYSYASKYEYFFQFEICKIELGVEERHFSDYLLLAYNSFCFISLDG